MHNGLNSRLDQKIAAHIDSSGRNSTFWSNQQTEAGILLGVTTDKSFDHIEMMIAKQIPLPKVLRILCLRSLVDNGLPKKSYEFFAREILQVEVLLNSVRN